MDADIGLSAMSEEYGANESEKEKSSKSVNRRSFVKSLGVASGAATFGVTGVGNAAGEELHTSQTDIKVTDTTIQERSAAIQERSESTSNVRSAMNSDQNQSIKNKFTYDLDLYPRVSNAVEVSVETNEARWNSHNPVIVMVPFTPADQEQERGGLLNTLVIEHQGEPLPVASFAASASPSTSKNAVSVQSSEDHVVIVYGTDKQGDVVQIDRGTQSTSDGISTQVTLGCATCTTIVGYLCTGGAGSLTVSACFTACLPAVSSGPGYLVCSGACGVIVRGVSAIGCGYTGSYICGELDYC